MLRGQKRPIAKVPQVKQDVRASIHNRFDVEVVDAVTGEIKQKACAENIVLDALWTRLLAPNTYFNYIHYGTGTGTLAATRTSLFTFLGAKAAGEKTLTYDWDNGWISSRKKIQIAPEEHVGSEFKEVGIGYSATASNLVTHALLKDMNGNTITIVKTATDVINIYATVFVHWDVAGYGGVKLLQYEGNYFLDEYLVGDYEATRSSATLYWFAGYPNTVGNGGDYAAVTLTYSAAEKKIIVPTTRLSVSTGNKANRGIKSMALGFYSHYANSTNYTRCLSVGFVVSAESAYSKSSIIGESLGTGDGTNKKFKTAFPFVKAGAKVYVDGVQDETVSVSDGPLVNTDLGQYFELIGGRHRAGINYAELPNPVNYWGNNTLAGYYGVYYNHLWEYGVESLQRQRVTIKVSDDLVNWTTLGPASLTGSYSIPAEHIHKKYWWIEGVGSYGGAFGLASTFDTDNVEFSTPPAAGAVITIDYDTESVAKDVNHVFDFSLTITLGEKTD